LTQQGLTLVHFSTATLYLWDELGVVSGTNQLRLRRKVDERKTLVVGIEKRFSTKVGCCNHIC